MIYLCDGRDGCAPQRGSNRSRPVTLVLECASSIIASRTLHLLMSVSSYILIKEALSPNKSLSLRSEMRHLGWFVTK